jgi:predicted nucleic acid-binding protein
MITAIDTNILIDVLAGTPEQVAIIQNAIGRVARQGRLVIPIVCYAELAGRFTTKHRLDDFIELMGATVISLEPDTAFLAGRFFREYLQRGGSRERIIADFLIAAQAQSQADRLLTKDKRFYGTTFPNLKAVSPADLTTPRSSK